MKNNYNYKKIIYFRIKLYIQTTLNRTNYNKLS